MGLSKYDRAARAERVIQAHTIGSMTEEEIASTLRLPRTTIHSILKKHKDRLDTHHAAIANALTRTQLGTLAQQRDVFYADLPIGMAEFRKLIRNRNPKIRLDAVKTLFDRVGLTPQMAERLLESAGVAQISEKLPSETTVNILIASIESLKQPIPQIALPPTPPALRSLQADTTAKTIDVEALHP